MLQYIAKSEEVKRRRAHQVEREGTPSVREEWPSGS
jgi:hypothetical protein